MSVSRKNLLLSSGVFCAFFSLWLGKKYINLWNTQSNSQKFQQMILQDDTSVAYNLRFQSDFYNKLYQFVQIAEMVKNELTVPESYQQVFHREIHRHLNYRSVMTIVCIINGSDLCDEGWVSKWGSPWLNVLEVAKFVGGRESKIFPHLMQNNLSTDELKELIDDEKCTNVFSQNNI